jgi:hypothetical protein
MPTWFLCFSASSLLMVVEHRTAGQATLPVLPDPARGTVRITARSKSYTRFPRIPPAHLTARAATLIFGQDGGICIEAAQIVSAGMPALCHCRGRIRPGHPFTFPATCWLPV